MDRQILVGESKNLGMELLVENELPESLSATVKPCDEARQFIDGLHLLLQKFCLQKVAQLRVSISRGNVVKIQKSLVDSFLKFESSSDSFQGRCPFVPGGLRNGLQNNSTSTFVLVLHKLFCMLTLFVRRLLEELVKSRQGNILTIEVISHGHVDIARVELHVDLLVDMSLAFLMVVLTAK